MSIEATGWAIAVPFLVAIFGSLFGGWLCDRLMLRRAALALSEHPKRSAAVVLRRRPGHWPTSVRFDFPDRHVDFPLLREGGGTGIGSSLR
jgi:hypothetical protein